MNCTYCGECDHDGDFIFEATPQTRQSVLQRILEFVGRQLVALSVIFQSHHPKETTCLFVCYSRAIATQHHEVEKHASN